VVPLTGLGADGQRTQRLRRWANEVSPFGLE